MEAGRTQHAADPELDFRIGGSVIGKPEIDLVESGEAGGGAGIADAVAGDGCSVEKDLEGGAVKERGGGGGELAVGSIGDGGAESGGIEDDVHSGGGRGGIADEGAVEAGGDDGFRVEGKQAGGEGNEPALDFRAGFAIEGDENSDPGIVSEDAGHEEVDLGGGDIPDGSGEAVDKNADSGRGKDSGKQAAGEVGRGDGACGVGQILSVDGGEGVGGEDGEGGGGMHDRGG